MRRAVKRLRALALAVLAPLLALGPAEAARELPPPHVIAAARGAVVRVQARNCDDGVDRNGSGFLFERTDQAATALHVVAGCGRIAIYLEESQATIAATLDRSVAASDLALLRLEREATGRPLKAAPHRLEVNDRMVAIGYAIGLPTKSDTELRLASGQSRLRDMLHDEARRAVTAAGLPSIDLEVMRLDGHLLPGLSGAPLIDATGHVVGVGDGGLEGGAVSISWGVPASELAALMAAPRSSRAPASVRAGQLFAAETSAADSMGRQIRCGERTFRKMRTRPYAPLAQSSDSPFMIQQVQAAMAQARIDPSSFRFDIYVEERSGAAVAIPAGWPIVQDEDGYCRADGPTGPAEMRFLGQSVRDLFDAEAKVQAFENMAVDYGLFIGHLDPDWSYASAYIRPDGLIVNRKSAALEPANYLSGLAPGYGTETLLVREDLFVGVVAYDRSPCRYQPYGPGCNPSQPVHIEYVQAALGSALSTMPCGPVATEGELRQFIQALAGPQARAWPNAFCTGR